MSLFAYFMTLDMLITVETLQNMKVIPEHLGFYYCSQTFSPKDADQKVDHHWSKTFVDTTTKCCSLLKCFLAKHCFPKDMKWNLTQQGEKHETLLWHKEKQVYGWALWQEETRKKFDKPQLQYLNAVLSSSNMICYIYKTISGSAQTRTKLVTQTEEIQKWINTSGISDTFECPWWVYYVWLQLQIVYKDHKILK